MNITLTIFSATVYFYKHPIRLHSSNLHKERLYAEIVSKKRHLAKQLILIHFGTDILVYTSTSSDI